MVYIAVAAAAIAEGVANLLGDAVLVREQLQMLPVPEFDKIEGYFDNVDAPTAEQRVSEISRLLGQGAGGIAVAADKMGIDLADPNLDPEHLAGIAKLAVAPGGLGDCLREMAVQRAYRVHIQIYALREDQRADRSRHELSWSIVDEHCHVQIGVVPDIIR